MSIKLFLSRHGSSQAYENIDAEEDVFRQTRFTPLSRDGIMDARKLAMYVSQLRPDVLLCSPFRRAQQTAEIVTEYNSYLFPNAIDDLGEIRRIVDGQSIYGDLNLRYKKWRGDAIRRRDLNSRFHPKDESFGEASKRSVRVVRWIENEFDNQTVLVIGHSQLEAMMITAMLEGDNPHPAVFFDSFNRHFMAHCAVTTMEKTPRSGWKMKKFNDTSHLK